MADDEDAWGSELEEDTGAGGVNKDILRKARALNPALAQQGSTTELFSKIKGGAGTPASAPAAGGGILKGNVDFATAFYETQGKCKEERKKLQDEITKLQKQLAEINPRTLDRVVDLIISIDANMVSPQTQEILKTETQFLNEIGFTVRKVIDKKMKKK
jgi:hypothetical protein